MAVTTLISAMTASKPATAPVFKNTLLRIPETGLNAGCVACAQQRHI